MHAKLLYKIKTNSKQNIIQQRAVVILMAVKKVFAFGHYYDINLIIFCMVQIIK